MTFPNVNFPRIEILIHAMQYPTRYFYTVKLRERMLVFLIMRFYFFSRVFFYSGYCGYPPGEKFNLTEYRKILELFARKKGVFKPQKISRAQLS